VASRRSRWRGGWSDVNIHSRYLFQGRRQCWNISKQQKKPSPEKREQNGSLKGLLGITVQKIGYLTHPSQCFGEKR